MDALWPLDILYPSPWKERAGARLESHAEIFRNGRRLNMNDSDPNWILISEEPWLDAPQYPSNLQDLIQELEEDLSATKRVEILWRRMVDQTKTYANTKR